MLLVDTNILVAAADAASRDHARCAAVLDGHTDIAVPVPVVVESAWMIESRLGPIAEASFVNSVATGELPVIDLGPEDWARCHELVVIYADLGLGLVDASVVAVAERRKVSRIATLNHRDFAVVRPSHCDAFELIP